jgi:DNA-binding Lrp family transcriptional regulator
MKDSRRSDRELAKALGISQPTVSRTIRKLQKEGIIKEYTVIPDFHKLGFEILAITFLAVEDEPDSKEFQESTSHNVLMAERGLGMNARAYSRVIISFHEDYSSYAEFERRLKQTWAVTDSARFLVNLEDAHGLFSFSALAQESIERENNASVRYAKV